MAAGTERCAKMVENKLTPIPAHMPHPHLSPNTPQGDTMQTTPTVSSETGDPLRAEAASPGSRMQTSTTVSMRQFAPSSPTVPGPSSYSVPAGVNPPSTSSPRYCCAPVAPGQLSLFPRSSRSCAIRWRQHPAPECELPW